MSLVQLQTVRFPLPNFLLTHDQQAALYNTYHASITAESAERLKYLKEEHQQRVQYEKEHHYRREKYMMHEHAEKMRILKDADGNGEIGTQRGAEERDEMEVDDTKPKIEAREQDDEGVEKSGNRLRRNEVDARK
jgi:hypothetical protein